LGRRFRTQEHDTGEREQCGDRETPGRPVVGPRDRASAGSRSDGGLGTLDRRPHARPSRRRPRAGWLGHTPARLGRRDGRAAARRDRRHRAGGRARRANRRRTGRRLRSRPRRCRVASSRPAGCNDSRGGAPRPLLPRSRATLLLRRLRRTLGERSRRGRRGRRCGRRSVGRGGALRQQRQRIDVALRILRHPDPQVHVRLVDLRLARRADQAHGLPFGHAVTRRDRDRAEMEERDREAVGRPDRHRAPVDRQRAGEGHAPSRGGADRRPDVSADVDPGVTVFAVLLAPEVETPDDGAVHGPRPRAGGRRRSKPRDQAGRDRRCHLRQHRGREPSRLDGCCQNGLQRAPIEPVSRHTGEPGDDVGGAAAREAPGNEFLDY
jgi:hypothetical protein